MPPSMPGTISFLMRMFAKVPRLDDLDATVVTPRFEDRDPKGNPRVVSFFAKRARGTMAAWLVRHRVRSAAKVSEFSADGYVLDEARSTRTTPVFVR